MPEDTSADSSSARTSSGVGRRVMRFGRAGLGPFHSPERLVGQLRADKPNLSTEDQVERLISWHCAQGAAQGAVSGVGGIVVLPVTLPLSLLAGGVIQARLAYAIALVYGHDLDSEQTRERVAACLIGAGKSSASAASIASPRMITQAVRKRLTRRVGAAVLTKVGGEGAARLLPVFGAATAGAVDYAFTRGVAKRAVQEFKPPGVATT